MLSRRHIRETAIQFLYLADFEDSPQASDMQEAFWEMTQESSLRKLNEAKAKAILHVARGRDSRIARLIEQASSQQTGLKAGDDGKKLGSALNHILAAEEKLSEAIESLQSSAASKSSKQLTDEKIRAVIDANHQLLAPR